MIRARYYVGSRSDGTAFAGWSAFRDRARMAALVVDAMGHPGATILPAVGLWAGTTEPSLVVELLAEGDPGTVTGLDRLAHALRETFDQDTVLWTVEGTHAPLTMRAAERPADPAREVA